MLKRSILQGSSHCSQLQLMINIQRAQNPFISPLGLSTELNLLPSFPFNMLRLGSRLIIDSSLCLEFYTQVKETIRRKYKTHQFYTYSNCHNPNTTDHQPSPSSGGKGERALLQHFKEKASRLLYNQQAKQKRAQTAPTRDQILNKPR